MSPPTPTGDPVAAPRLAPTAAAVAILTAAAAYVMVLVGERTIAVVARRGLLPRWDLATHLVHGWIDYHLLATGRIHLLLWDLWQQGYWPPGLSLWQMPFYAALGGGLTAGLWSTAAAFVLLAATGSAILIEQRSGAGIFAASVFVALLISSPYVLAFASLTMTEVPGALAQLLVLLCYLRWRQEPRPRRAVLFALSLTVLFFIKYNYFVMLAVPMALHEWLERTSGWTPHERTRHAWAWVRRSATSFTGRLLLLYGAGLLLVIATGGFQFRVLGVRVSIRGVGNSGLVVFYVLLLRLWYLHRRGRIDWRRLTTADPRIRPLLVWFVLPVAVWLASPHPNHIRDLANLVINRPHGGYGIGGGLPEYGEALRSAYFYSPWVLTGVVGAFLIAALQYRRQPPVMRVLVIAVPLQIAAIALHQTWSTRFLVLPVVLLCLAAAGEVGRWFAGPIAGRSAVYVLAPLAIVGGLFGAHQVVADEPFRTVAFEPYTDSPVLRTALDAIRGDLTAEDRVLVVGETDQLSPALFRWELGPPSGVACFPFQIGGAGRLDPSLATRILLIVSPGAPDPLGFGSNDPARLQAIRADIERGALVLRRDVALGDLQATLRVYQRPAPPPRAASCRS